MEEEETTQPSNITQSNPIVTWAKDRPHWEKYVWKNCLENGTLTEEEEEEAYRLFKIENEIDESEDLTDIDLSGLVPPDEIDSEPIYLDELRKCKNLNAIPEGQVIKFGKQLTLVWGKNGSGKSGYGRILASACFSRGERIIHPNLKKDDVTTDPAQAEFHIDDGSEDGLTLEYVNGGRNFGELKRFSMFDKDSVPVQLNQSNSVQFRPGQLKVFDQVRFQISQIEEAFNDEKRERQKHNPVENSFGDKVSKVSDVLLDFNVDTTDAEINDLTTFPVRGDEQLEKLSTQIEGLVKLDVPEKQNKLSSQELSLTSYKRALENSWDFATDESVVQLNELIEEANEKKVLVAALGADKFDDGLFKTIGSEKWKALLLAAREVFFAEQTTNEPVELSHCMLCHQNLTVKEEKLFKDYWSFLESTAEKELTDAVNQLEEYSKALTVQITKLPDTAADQPAIKLLLEGNEEYVTKIRQEIEQIGAAMLEWATAIEKLESLSTENVPELDTKPITLLVESKKKEREELEDPTEQIKKLKQEVVELEHRKLVAELKNDILEYVEWIRWNTKASTARIPKTIYTAKRTEYFNEIVTDDYTKLFNEESEKLNGQFGLEVESRGEQGDTLLSLKFDFAKDAKPTEVLSEGEQKVCAIAEFLTEVRLDNSNCGIVLDDPVTSLDHDRKERIAERLAEESANRQVIIFTHDITFFLSLQHYANRKDLDVEITTIRSAGGTPGLCNPKLPWVAQKVRDRKGVLNAKLQELGALIRGGATEEEIEEKVKTWYVLLREAWERGIEERLFKGTIERFKPSIETNRLKTVVISKEQIDEVVNAMTDSSKWLHDRAAGQNVPTPDVDELQSHMDQFKDFIAACTAD
jgi:hypothetical protein